jgi:hypothetical protein
MDEGRACVYHGSASGLATAHAWSAESNQAGARYGRSASGVGDVNGDGYSDVIVGAHYYSAGQAQEGWAYLYHGGAGGLAGTAACELYPDFRTTGDRATRNILKRFSGLIWGAIGRDPDGNTKEAADIWRKNKGESRD